MELIYRPRPLVADNLPDKHPHIHTHLLEPLQQLPLDALVQLRRRQRLGLPLLLPPLHLLVDAHQLRPVFGVGERLGLGLVSGE